MYELDFTTATPRDVINRSLVCHPSLFREAIEAQAIMHEKYAYQTHDKEASRIALKCAADCLEVSRLLGADEIGEIMQELSFWIPALNVAFRLQCVPRSLHADIVKRA